MKPVELAKICALAFIVSAVVAVTTSYLAWRLPPAGSHPEIHNEPIQSSLLEGQDATLVVSIQDHQYSIKPRYNYHLTGLVVATSDAMGWRNITHRAAGDFLNTNDICVVWGANAEELDLSQFTFTHGDWTCYVSTSSSEAWRKFKMDGLANNHVLPSTPELAARFRDVRIGDSIVIDGQLVDYSTDGGASRTTSVVRTDTGNGACEIIYVTDFQFISRHHETLYRIARLAMDAMVLSLVVLGAALFIWPFLRRND